MAQHDGDELHANANPDKFESMITPALSASTHYRLARSSHCRGLIIQYIEEPRKYGLHGLDAVAMSNTVAAMIGAVHLDVKQNLGADTEEAVSQAMNALGFTDVVAQVVNAWTVYNAEIEAEKVDEIINVPRPSLTIARLSTDFDAELAALMANPSFGHLFN